MPSRVNAGTTTKYSSMKYWTSGSIGFSIKDVTSGLTSSMTLSASTSSFTTYEKATTWTVSLSGTNNHNIKLGATSITTKLSANDNYTILVIPITFTQHAYYAHSDTTKVNAGSTDDPCTDRFNFQSYTLDDSASSTIPSGTVTSDTTQSITLQVNLSQMGCYTNPSGSYYYRTTGASMTLNYAAEKYTVTYNANGGSGAPASQTEIKGTALTLSSTVPTKTGYNFLGWSKSSTATTATYKAGGSYSENSSATLYAVWQAKTATVVFKANGGVGSDVTKTYTYDVSGQSFPGVIFTREGYTMAGWAKSASATSQDYLSNATPTNAYINSNAGTTVTLYAVWTPITYTLRFDANGGEGSMEDQTVTYGVSGQYVNLNEFTRAGYEFLGWNAYRTSDDKWFTTSGWYTKEEIDANGYEMFLYTDGVVVAKTCYIDGDVAIMYAQWGTQSYTVSFDANGGVGSMEDQVVNVGAETDLPVCTFTKDNMMFAGWGLTADGDAVYSDGAAVTDIAEPGGTVKLYAIWVKMAAFDTSSVYEDADMFTGCVNLEGGNGTTYGSNHTDSEYAKIDRDGTPGYFTKK